MKRMLFVAAVAVCLAAACVAAGCGRTTEPEITLITPAGGPPSTEILISGSGFGDGTQKAEVRLDGKAIAVTSWSDTGIRATIPKDAPVGTRTVTVVSGDTTSKGYEFEVMEASPAPEPSQKTETKTQKEVIIAYCDANNMWHPVPEVKQGQMDGIVKVQASDIDPDWELWCRPIGEGDDIYFFLLEKVDGAWTVVKCDLRGGSWATEAPQQYGAPGDITIPPEPWWPGS